MQTPQIIVTTMLADSDGGSLLTR